MNAERAMRLRLAALALGLTAVSLLPGCDPDVIVGHETSAGVEAPGVPWSAGHETGNLDEWMADGQGWDYLQAGGELGISSEQAHAGRYSIKATISPDGDEAQAVVARRLTLREGSYSAYYYLPVAPVTDAWVLMKLSSQDEPADRFDIDIGTDASGAAHLFLWEHAVGTSISDAAQTPALPIGAWFEIEAFYRATPDGDGRMVVYQDGVQVIDTGPRATAPDDRVTFIVGSVADYADPKPLAVFIDDVEIQAAPGGP